MAHAITTTDIFDGTKRNSKFSPRKLGIRDRNVNRESNLSLTQLILINIWILKIFHYRQRVKDAWPGFATSLNQPGPALHRVPDRGAFKVAGVSREITFRAPSNKLVPSFHIRRFSLRNGEKNLFWRRNKQASQPPWIVC